MDCIYHGSNKQLEILIPQKAYGFGGDVDCHEGVYGVENINLAIPFTFTFINVKEGSVFSVNTDVDPPEVTLKGCEVDWDKKGYLYKLPKTTFEKVDELQWVSPVPVMPIEVSVINPLDYKHWVVR